MAVHIGGSSPVCKAATRSPPSLPRRDQIRFPAMGVTARRELPPTRLGAYALRALLRAKAASRSDSVIQHVRQMPYMFCWPSPVAMINCKHSVCEQL